MKDNAQVQKDIQMIMKTLGIDTKANEAMSSTQASYGDEFVPTDLSSEIVEKARQEESFFSLIPQGQVINMPTNPYQLTVEGADPTFYKTSEEPDFPGTEITKSKAGTGNLTLTATKFSASVPFTAELDEDSLIAMRPYITSKLAKKFTEVRDQAILLGDTESGATGNINSDDGALSSTSPLIAFDGILKHAFAESNTADVGALTAGDFITVRKELDSKLGARPNDLMLVMNHETYLKTLQLAQVETAEKFSGATIEDGVLTAIYGMRIHVATDFGLAEADGKVSTTAANNTLGRFMIVHMPSVVVGVRRDPKINVEYLPRTDQYVVTMHTRFTADMTRSNAVAAGYNVTV